MEKLPSKKLAWLSYLRVSATINVIILHVSVCVVYQFGNISSVNWWIGNIFDSISRFCVPVFVMITGALLLPQEIGLKSFMKKRLKRIIIPFLFWSIIYVIHSLVTESAGIGNSFTEIFKFAYSKLTDGAAYHLWYVYMIIGLYLCTPILHTWLKNCTEKELLYFLCIWFATLFIQNQIIYKYFPKILLSFFSGYIGYLVFGYYLSVKSFEKVKNIQLISVLMIISGIVITSIGTFVVSTRQNGLNELFYNFLSPNVFLISAGIFLLFKLNSDKKTQIPKIINFIDKYSYGIYLAHVLVLTSLVTYNVLNIEYFIFNNSLIAILLLTSLCLIISAGITFLLNKLPLGKYISG